MECIELDNYYSFLNGGYLEEDQVDIENSINVLLNVINSKIEDITEVEFETAVEEVTAAIENLTNSLSELSEVFTEAKQYLAKEDKKWEDNV